MTTALEGGECSAARPSRTLLPGKNWYLLYMRLGGPQGQSGRVESLVPTGIRSRTVQPLVSRYTNWATWPTLKLTICNTNHDTTYHNILSLNMSTLLYILSFPQRTKQLFITGSSYSIYIKCYSQKWHKEKQKWQTQLPNYCNEIACDIPVHACTWSYDLTTLTLAPLLPPYCWQASRHWTRHHTATSVIPVHHTERAPSESRLAYSTARLSPQQLTCNGE